MSFKRLNKTLFVLAARVTFVRHLDKWSRGFCPFEATLDTFVSVPIVSKGRYRFVSMALSVTSLVVSEIIEFPSVTLFTQSVLDSVPTSASSSSDPSSIPPDSPLPILLQNNKPLTDSHVLSLAFWSASQPCDSVKIYKWLQP